MSTTLKHYEEEMAEDFERPERVWIKRRALDKKLLRKLSKKSN